MINILGEQADNRMPENVDKKKKLNSPIMTVVKHLTWSYDKNYFWNLPGDPR